VTISHRIRRTTLFGLALLLFLVAVGPACLMYASEAIGMPMGMPHPAPMDCGDTDGDSSVACPHSNSVEITNSTQRSDAVTLDIVAVTDVVAPMQVSANVLFVRAERYLSPPPSQLIPLRL